jgi:ABC-type branched-subunit amino acid transport system substrate-binding protein
MEDFGDMNTMISNYNSLIANSSIDFLVGPVASDFAIEASLLTEAAGKVLVAWNAASDLFFQNKQMAYSLSPPSSMFVSLANALFWTDF